MRKEAGPLVPLAADRVTAQLHSFDRAVRSARARIALSVPHSDLERSDRETSSLLIEVGAALGRPDGEREAVIPDLQSLGRTSFGPARAAASAFRAEHPVTEVQWLDRSAATSEIPPAWKDGRHLALPRILALRDRDALGAADGVLGNAGPFPVLPGLAPEKPISASALEAIVGCPLRFLYHRVMKWEEPAGPSTVRELDSLTYGSLLHEVADRFYSAHGPDFVARKGTLGRWQRLARAIGEEEFEALRVRFPLVGRGVEEKERGRLLRDLDSFLDYDWHLPLDRFVGVELPFDGLALDAGKGELHVRGYIDRIDVEEGHALVRDLKSGHDHPRTGKEECPVPTRDIQLGLYGLVARKKAREWNLPAKLQAAYVYPRNAEERAFRADHADLEKATRQWLGIAHGLLAEQSFPPSPSTDDCKYCVFRPICDGPERASAALEDAEDAVDAFFEMKVGTDEEDAR
jgi:RecB family exonuclease